jgi:di/tricarboxylate transporter
MSLDEIFAAIKGRVILAIVATFGVSAAMEKTGVARFIAQGLVHVCKQASAPQTSRA